MSKANKKLTFLYEKEIPMLIFKEMEVHPRK